MSQNGHTPTIELPESYHLRLEQGKKQLDPVRALSLQKRADESSSGGVHSWWFARYNDGSEIAPYWSEQRDRDLRLFWHREGNDILQGATGSMLKWGRNLAWVLEGPERVVNREQEKLSEAEFGEGWGTLVSKALFDYLTQDKGATIEVIGAGKPDGPIKGPALGLAHLDAQYVQPTGDLEYPVVFQNSKDKTYHKIHHTRVIRIVDMPSPNELLCGVGFCAVSRIIAASQVLLKLARYKNEKLSDMPEAGLLLLNNILPHQWEDAKAQHSRERRKVGNELWQNIMAFMSVDPAQPATANFVSFANLPESFDELQSTNIYVAIVALSFGVDPREFWPMSGGPLGSGREAQVMAEKAKGKGKADVIAAFERAVNWKFLPSSVNFRFDFRDDEEDRLKAEIDEKKTTTIMSMWKPESLTQGLQPPVSALEIRQMLADNVSDYFKPEFLEVVATDEVEATDTEREDGKALGPMVRVDSKGRKRRIPKRQASTDDIWAMAEKNYRDGLIDIDQLLGFRRERENV